MSRWVARHLVEHPQGQVQAQTELTNRALDTVHEGIDVAILVGTLPDSALSARKLGDLRYGLCASPAYLRTRAAPKTPQELAQHGLIVFGGITAIWTLHSGDATATIRPQARLAANNNPAVRYGEAQGLGIALLPEFQARPLVASRQLKPA